MGNRIFARSVAKALYTEFSRRWRRERRFNGKAGKPGFRKPSFRQWSKMHSSDIGMMAESTPSDVQEHMGLDPWVVAAPTSDLPSSMEGFVVLDESGSSSNEQRVIESV